MLVQEGEMETNAETSGSGYSLDFEYKNSDHTMDENLEDNHDEDSSKEVQVAIVDDTISEVSQPNIQADIRYKTKHANEIAKVLGTSQELKEFDTVRYQLKSKPTLSKDVKQKHKRLLYKLQLSVKHKRSTLVTQLSSLEKQYFLQHCQLPKPNDSPEHDDIMTQIKHINKLLRVWNIHVTD